MLVLPKPLVNLKKVSLKFIRRSLSEGGRLSSPHQNSDL